MDSTEPFNVAAFADDKTAWSIEHDRSGEPSVPDLLARIDADAIVARIDNAIACTIRPSELEAVRAIVCDAVTAGQDAGIEIARLQREHRARHAVEQVDGSAMLRELGADPVRWADPLNADVLLPLGTDASKWATAFME